MVTRTIDTSSGRLLPLACEHRRQAAYLAEQHLRSRGLWGSWQMTALLAGRCPRCDRRTS